MYYLLAKKSTAPQKIPVSPVRQVHQAKKAFETTEARGSPCRSLCYVITKNIFGTRGLQASLGGPVSQVQTQAVLRLLILLTKNRAQRFSVLTI